MLHVSAFLFVAAAGRNYGYVRNPQFAGAHGGVSDAARETLPYLSFSNEPLPQHFDWRNVDGVNFVVADVQQHAPVYCGSCWIHAAVAMLNDRLKIQRRAAFPDVMLARQVLLNCAPHVENGTVVVGYNGCDGGDERDIYQSLMNRSNWLPDETCQPYEAVHHSCDALHTCTNCLPSDEDFEVTSCFEVPSFVTYGVASWRQVTSDETPDSAREAAMQREIFAHGPIVCTFAAIGEFDSNYTKVARQHAGVFRTKTKVTQDDINHDIELVGWGVSKLGVKYWIGRNSWGTFWGENGWFRLERGVNALLVEGACSSARPTHSELDREMLGAESGGPTGLEELASKERWSHQPRLSRAPSGFDETSVGLFATLNGADDISTPRFAVAHRSVLAVVAALSCAIGISAAAFAAGVAVTRRRQLRSEAELEPQADGLRVAILRNGM